MKSFTLMVKLQKEENTHRILKQENGLSLVKEDF